MIGITLHSLSLSCLLYINHSRLCHQFKKSCKKIVTDILLYEIVYDYAMIMCGNTET